MSGVSKLLVNQGRFNAPTRNQASNNDIQACDPKSPSPFHRETRVVVAIGMGDEALPAP